MGSLAGSGLADSLGRKTALLLDAVPLLVLAAESPLHSCSLHHSPKARKGLRDPRNYVVPALLL